MVLAVLEDISRYCHTQGMNECVSSIYPPCSADARRLIFDRVCLVFCSFRDIDFRSFSCFLLIKLASPSSYLVEPINQRTANSSKINVHIFLPCHRSSYLNVDANAMNGLIAGNNSVIITQMVPKCPRETPKSGTVIRIEIGSSTNRQRTQN